MVDIIIAEDLAGYPGVAASEKTLDWVANAATNTVSDAWVNQVDPVPQWVKDIAVNAALRVIINPKGLEMLSRQLDDSKRTETYAKEFVGKVGIYLTADDIQRLSGAQHPGVGTIRTQPRGWCG